MDERQAYLTILLDTAKAQQNAGALEDDFKALEERIKKLDEMTRQFSKTSGSVDVGFKGDVIRELDNLKEIYKQLQVEVKTCTSEEEAYALTLQDLRGTIRDVEGAMLSLSIAGKKDSAEYKQLTRYLGEMKQAMSEVEAEAKVSGDRLSSLSGIIAGANGIAGAVSAVVGAFQLFGNESANFQKAQKNIQSLIAITIGLQQTLNILQRDSVFRIKTVRQVTDAWNKSVKFLNVTLGVNLALSKALMVSGIGVIIAGIGALIAVIAKLRKKQEEMNALRAEHVELSKEVAGNVAEELVEIDALIAVANNYNASLVTREKAISKLKSIMPDYNAYINEEGTLIDNASTSVKEYTERLIALETARAKIKQAAALREEIETPSTPSMTAMQYSFRSLFAGKEKRQSMYEQIFEPEKVKEELKKKYETLTREIAELVNDGNIDKLFEDNATDKAKKEYDAIAAINSQVLDLQRQSAEMMFQLRKDNLAKTLAALDNEHAQQIAKMQEFENKVIDEYNESNGTNVRSLSAIDKEASQRYYDEIQYLDDVYNARKIAETKKAEDAVMEILKEMTDLTCDEYDKQKDEIVKKYKNIEQQVISITGKITTEQRQMIEAAREREQQSFDARWVVEYSESIKTLFGDISRMSGASIREAIESAKTILEANKQVLEDSEYAKYLEVIANAEEELISRNPIQQLLSAFKNGDVKAIGNYAAAAAGGILKLVDAMRSLASSTGDAGLDDTADKLEAFASNVQAAGNGAQSGGWIGAIVGGVLNMAEQLVAGWMNARAQTSMAQQAMEDYYHSLKLNQLSVNDSDYDNPFGAATLEKTRDAAIKAGEAQKELNDYLNKRVEITAKLTNYAQMQYLQQLNASQRGFTELQGMSVKTRDRSGFANFFGSEDEYTSLKDYKPDLWNQDGTFNVDNARLFLETDEKITEEQRKQLQYAIDLSDKYEENKEIIEETTRSFFGDIASDWAESIWDNYILYGEDAIGQVSRDMSASLAGVAAAFGKQMLTELLQTMLMEKYGKEVQSLIAGDGGDMATLVGDMVKDMSTWSEKGMEFTAEYQKALEAAGVSLSEAQGSESLKGAIQGIQEKTASLIAGQLNAIRMSQASSNQIMQRSLEQLTRITANTEYCRHLESIDVNINKMINNDNRLSAK